MNLILFTGYQCISKCFKDLKIKNIYIYIHVYIDQSNPSYQIEVLRNIQQLKIFSIDNLGKSIVQFDRDFVSACLNIDKFNNCSLKMCETMKVRYGAAGVLWNYCRYLHDSPSSIIRAFTRNIFVDMNSRLKDLRRLAKVQVCYFLKLIRPLSEKRKLMDHTPI